MEPSSRLGPAGTGRSTGRPGAVIVPLDGSASARDALPLATYLSTAFQAPLHRVSVTVTAGPAPAEGREAHADALTLLRGGDRQAQAQPARAAWTSTGGPPPPPPAPEAVGVVSGDGDVEVVLQGDSVAGALLDYATRHPDALVCMATRARGGLHRRLMGNVVEEMLGQARCPVIAVGPRVDLAETAQRPETILLAAAAEPPRATVPLLASWARMLGAQVVVAQVSSAGRTGSGGDPWGDRQAADRMVSWFARHRAPAFAQRLRAGPVPTALLELAEQIGGPMLVAAPVSPYSGVPVSDLTHELLQHSRWPVIASVGSNT